HPRRGRPLRRAARALRAQPAGGGLRPLPGASPPGPDGGRAPHKRAGGGEMSPTVEAPIRARLGGPLKLAIPRGALWGETLDALDRIGLKTAEVRGDSRSLVFNVNGLTLVTMRPSDVPTYVEAGAADLGITGKDVLLEQQGDRIVYEILDLAYGACRMVLAGRQGDPSLGESERRVGEMRIATKYPRIAE